MNVRRRPVQVDLDLASFLEGQGPGDPLEVLRERQEEDAAWAARAFEGREPLSPPIRLRRGRPRAGEAAPAPTVVKAIRLPVHLLEGLQGLARAQGRSLNALLQTAALDYLTRHQG